jgi:hypothetical protein
MARMLQLQRQQYYLVEASLQRAAAAAQAAAARGSGAPRARPDCSGRPAAAWG